MQVDAAYCLTPQEAQQYIAGSESWPLRDVVASLVNNLSVLEVGCANGIQAARFSASQYTGVDWSTSLLDEARKRLPNHRFIEADALSLPFGREFEVAYAISLFEHLPNAESAHRCLSEMLRVANRVFVGWHTPPTNEATELRWVTGHFGKQCWSNRYRIADIIEPSRIIYHEVKATDGSLVWEVESKA
jgi:trans-aconitate methyltransferase